MNQQQQTQQQKGLNNDYRIKYKQRIDELQEHIKQLNDTKKQYKELIERLKTLPDTLTQKTRVSLGKHAFFEGDIVNTNEILVLLGDNYFTQRSAKQTIDIIQRRDQDIDDNIKEINQQIEGLNQRLTLTSDLSKIIKQRDNEDIIDIKEEYDSDEEREKQKIKDKKQQQQLASTLQSNNETNNKLDKEVEQDFDKMFARLLELEKLENQDKELNPDGDEEDQEEYEDVIEYYDEDGNRIEVDNRDDVEFIQEYDDGDDGPRINEENEDDEEEEAIKDEIYERDDGVYFDEQDEKDIKQYINKNRSKYGFSPQTNTTTTSTSTNSPKSILKQSKQSKPPTQQQEKMNPNNPLDFIQKVNKHVSFGDIPNDVSRPNPPKNTVFSGNIIEKSVETFELDDEVIAPTPPPKDTPKESRFKSSRRK